MHFINDIQSWPQACGSTRKPMQQRFCDALSATHKLEHCSWLIDIDMDPATSHEADKQESVATQQSHMSTSQS